MSAGAPLQCGDAIGGGYIVGMSYTVHQPVDARLIFSIAMIWIINVGRMLRIPLMDRPIFGRWHEREAGGVGPPLSEGVPVCVGWRVSNQ